MNFEIQNHRLYNAQKPLKGMQYNKPESYPDIRRNKLYIPVPQLMQTRPVTGMTNSKRFTTQPQVTSNTIQKASYQNGLGLNRNKDVSEASPHQRSFFKAKKALPSTSKAEYYFDNRISRNTSIPFNITETSAQDNPAPIQRSTLTSAASSVVEFNSASRCNLVPNQSAENSDKNFIFRIFGKWYMGQLSYQTFFIKLVTTKILNNSRAKRHHVYFLNSTENEKMFIFTGTVERVIKWNKIFRNHFCYYEVIASVISIQEGAVNTQKIMLLRDKKGPILQVVYYNTTHIDIEDFYVDRVLRCLGRMSGPNILNAVSIRSADQEEIETLQRHCLACDQAISHFLNV